MKITSHAKKPYSKAFLGAFEKLSIKIRKNFTIYGLFEKELIKNKYGEEVATLDKVTNDLICNTLDKLKIATKIYSEELTEAFNIEGGAPYFVTIDPLDGSSNIKSNNVFGSIVGVYDKDMTKFDDAKVILSFFIIYGPVTTLTYCEGKNTHTFILKQDEKFHLLIENQEFKSQGGVFGIGGKLNDYFDKFRQFKTDLELIHGLKNRYCGAFVGDFMQILIYSGFFSYPKTNKNPNGKLRLFYEAKPMAFIARGAKGNASDGQQEILEIKSTDIDARTPVYIGSKKYVELAISCFK